MMNLTIQALLLAAAVAAVSAKKVHYIHWNRNNPMFRIDNTDHIVDVNRGNLPWEYDQVNLICPVSKPGSRYPEKHVIYSVTKEEFDSCRITNPKPRIVAVCNKPHRLMYFTITFRSFTPTPGGLEFHPGQDYYFISTSSREDLHRRVGGGCSTNNMKMIFKVNDNRQKKIEEQEQLQDLEQPLDQSPEPVSVNRPAAPHRPQQQPQQRPESAPGEYIYYYHPRDLIELEKSISMKKRINLDVDNEMWSGDSSREEALKYTSSVGRAASPVALLALAVAAGLSILLR